MKYLVLLSFICGFTACALIRPREQFKMGMSENRFLRQNPTAVISHLNETQKVYRLDRNDRFYALVTFDNGKLVNVEEKELTPQWPQNQMQIPQTDPVN